MSGALMKISPRDLPVPRIKTVPAWKKPVIDYPKDATIIEIPYKWDRKPAKQGKKEKPKRTYSVLTGKERRNWTEDEIEKLICMYNDGASYIDIMEAVRHSESSIATKLTQLRSRGRIAGVRSKDAWTQEEVDTLLTMKDQGHSLEKISKALGKSYASVWSKNRKIEDKKECKKR